jgi:hypothetical protein
MVSSQTNFSKIEKTDISMIQENKVLSRKNSPMSDRLHRTAFKIMSHHVK